MHKKMIGDCVIGTDARSVYCPEKSGVTRVTESVKRGQVCNPHNPMREARGYTETPVFAGCNPCYLCNPIKNRLRRINGHI